MLLSALLPTLQVFADDTVPSAGETNAKTTSMLSLFRDNATEIDAGKVSEEEYRVYGVFLSNYFMPGKTTVKDLKSSNTELISKVSKAFTGGDSISTQVGALNDKLYEGISHLSDGLGSATAYTLTKGDKQPISGAEFLNTLASGGKVYLNGKEVIDFKNDKAMRGALQILMGVSPDLFMGVNKSGGLPIVGWGANKSVVGIAAMDRLYMDGVGNIWGSYKPTSGSLPVDDYVLIMPGCLNPLTFNRKKVPLSNAFAMGAMVDVSSMSLAKDDEALRPYYNIKSTFSTGKDNANMMNIYGVHSPTKYVGNTDSIINAGNKLTSAELKSAINSFVTNTSSSSYTGSELKIIFSLDMSKYDGFKSNLKEIITDSSNIQGFAEYFGTNLVFGMGEISDDMYFFTDTNESGVGSNNIGSFKDNNSLMKNHKMFAEYDGSKYSFYSNGVQRGKFSLFLEEYVGTNDITKKKELIKTKLLAAVGKADVKDAVDTVYNFLETSRFKKGSVSDLSTLKNASSSASDVLAMVNFLDKNEAKLYNTVQKPTSVAEYERGWFKTEGGVVLGMAHLDTYLATATFGKYNKNGKSPFGGTIVSANGGGGVLEGTLSASAQDSVATLFHTVNTYNIFSIDASISKALKGSDSGSEIVTPWGTYKTYTNVANSVNNWPGIYWAYTVSLLGTKVTEDGVSASGWSNNYLPGLTINTTGTLNFSDALTGGGLSASDDKTIEDMQKDIIRKIYGLLSEDDNSYRASLIDTTIDGFILNTHRALVGSWIGENFVVGTGKTYTSAVGYLSTPSLQDLPLTSWLLDDYAMIYMFSLLLILMIVVVMVITNNRSMQEGVILFLVMGVVLMIPQSLVVNVVNITNSMTDKMYSNKFNYWAISQHHELVENGLKAGGSAESDMAYTMELNKDFSSSDARVRIKWMSPKKEEEFDKLYKNESKLDGIENNLVLAKFLMGNFMSQSEYVMNSDESYLYRPYTSIVNSAKNMYLEMGSGASDLTTLKGNIQSGKNLIDDVPSYRFDGLMGNITEKGDKTLMSKVDTYSVDSNVNDSYKYWGLGNFGVTSSIFRDDYTIEEAGLTGYTDDAEYSAFLLMTESPYYYFYNVFKARYSSVNGGFKNALLEPNVFKVSGTGTDADGELRDFLDLDGLFTNVVPYLKQANEYVNGWTSVYGSTIDSYDFENGGAGEEYQEQYESAKRKKEALKNVWMLYSPWVDGVYESAGGKERTKGFVMVDDPLNPGAYAEASSTRRMCFSPAEREALGYNEYVLTDAEIRIQKVLEGTYKDLMYLINYYDFNDEVLLSMASMLATFNFNKEFSQYRMLGNSTIIYPQNFELKNFNFDAYMRLMLVNATGEPMKGSGDLYERVLAKTSVFTGLLLLVVDVLGVIIIPAIKLLALILIFLLSVVIAFSCILVPTDKISKRLLDSLFKPLGLLMVALVGFSFVMSLFMGEGYTSYVGSKTPTLGITDPNILMLLIALVSCGYLYVLLKIVGITWKHLKSNGIATALGFVATAISLGSVVTNNVKNGVSKVGRAGLSGAKGILKAPGTVIDKGLSAAEGINDLRHGYHDVRDSIDDTRNRLRDLRNKDNTPIEDSDGSKELSEHIDNLASTRGNYNSYDYNMDDKNRKQRDTYNRRVGNKTYNSNIISKTADRVANISEDWSYANERRDARKEKNRNKKSSDIESSKSSDESVDNFDM